MKTNNKKSHAFKRTSALATAAVLALIALFGMTACPNNASGGGGGSTVNITVRGDEHINLPAEPVAVRSGAKWAEVQSTVKSKVSAKTGWLLDTWHLGEDENAPELKDTDMFVKDTTVFLKSRADLPDLSPIQGGSEQVKITLGITPAGAGSILGPTQISVNKNTPWNPLLKTYAAAALKVSPGYELVGWKKNGTLLDDTFSFDADANIFADLKDMRITVTVNYGKGSGSPTTAAGNITVLDGDKWKDVSKEASKNVPCPEGFIREWHWNDAGGEEISDNYIFKASDGPRTVYALIKLVIKYEKYAASSLMTYYAPQSGTVTESYYCLDKIPAVTNGTIGHSGLSNNGIHQVSLNAYRIGVTEIPQNLYELVMGTNPSHFKGSLYPPAPNEIQELRPVENVNWYDCIAFCNELTRYCSNLGESECVYTLTEGGVTRTYTVQDARDKKVPDMDRSKKGFRLPTEAEWEWAAQGGTKRRIYPVPQGGSIYDYIWEQSNSDGKTHQGLKKEKHPDFNLYDICGNVGEWCWDWYKHETPAGGDNPTGAPSGTKRIRRGGSMGEQFSRCKCAFRFCYDPETKNDSTGLRIVCKD